MDQPYHDKHRHLPVLDGVRGLAVFLVILFHFFSIGFGWLGVDLFFVLSGFLITGILVDNKNKESYFLNFYARRTLRIFPLYYFALLIYFILVKSGAAILKDPGYFTTNMEWFLLYIQNWLFALHDWPKDHSLNHFWSLAIEEQFYLFWPLIVFYTPLKKLPWICAAMILLSLSMRYYTWYDGITVKPFQYTATVCRLDGLAIGAAIASLIRISPGKLFNISPWLFALTIPAGLTLYLLAGSLKYDNYYYLTAGLTVFDLFFGALLIAVLQPGKIFLQKLFSMRWLRWLGRYSYGIYVYHWIIYQVLWPWFKRYSGNPVLADVRYIYGFLCLVLTLMVSYISYRLLEEPLLKLKKRFE